MRQLRWLAASLLMLSLGLGSPQARAADPAPGYGKLRPARLRTGFQKASATQFLSADRKGRLFLLRGDTLEVFRLRVDGDPESVGTLACRQPKENTYAAAMDPGGSTWAVASTAFDLAICGFTEQRRPSGLVGIVSSLAFSGTGPLVSVVPFGRGGMDAAGRVSAKVPLVFKLEGSAWKPVHAAPFPEMAQDSPIGFMTRLKAQTDSLLCAGPKGSLWLASWNSYRVEEVSSFEKARKTLTVGKGGIEWVKLTAEERAANDADIKKRGMDPGQNRGGQVYPQNVIRATVCAPDGAVYLFVTTGEGLALDRFEPAQRSVERILLDGVKVSGGPMSATLAGGDLFFGGRYVQDGLWRIRLEDLADAPWKPVRGARINGKPAS